VSACGDWVAPRFRQQPGFEAPTGNRGIGSGEILGRGGEFSKQAVLGGHAQAGPLGFGMIDAELGLAVRERAAGEAERLQRPAGLREAIRLGIEKCSLLQ
jgi:hypothetical protein